MNELKCPICGKENSIVSSSKLYEVLVGSGCSSKSITTYKCNKCFYQDEPKENDEIKKQVLREARQKCVSDILNNLESKMSYIEIERMLSLPPKTLSKWKNGSKFPSAAATALIRLLDVFPWLVLVAAADFKKDIAYDFALKAITSRMSENRPYIVEYRENTDYKGLMIVTKNSTENYYSAELEKTQKYIRGEIK